MVRETIEFEESDVARFIYGRRDANLRILEEELEVEIGARGNEATISGSPPDVKMARRVLREIYELGKKGFPISETDVGRAVQVLTNSPQASLVDIFTDTVFVSSNNKVIAPKGLNQKRYVDAIRRNDIVFGVGPAGTGKTYLAMAMALNAYFDKEIKRIILVRPAVEAGEKLGFLPGDLAEKVNPYLRPLYDAIHDMVDQDRAERMIEHGAVEVAPLAFMRGRTLNDAFIILDEAQNSTSEQMKMFLTRIGFGSQAVITGDITQIDLPSRKMSGLVQAERILANIDGIDFCYFTEVDVVRHPLVQKIITAYDRDQR
ncbi:PhoH family protein [Persicimonas caeni]|uniref:PhoH-like protein n=1 Tax=Persicimonas caeni TaxID=2292766 RepID=A0A4Y6Q380_PERCE|nr:PhoH family protein [Persicimonas caeni]QED36204.1 PhoH family protein [Persicimonas caeni]